MSAESLALAGVVAVIVPIALVIRECLRPEPASHWSERDFGDQPDVSVFHSSVNSTGAQRDHGL